MVSLHRNKTVIEKLGMIAHDSNLNTCDLEAEESGIITSNKQNTWGT